MLKTIYTFILLALIGVACQQQKTTQQEEAYAVITSDEERAVKQLVQDSFDQIWSSLDTAEVRKYHEEDFLLLEHGMVWDNDTIRSYQLREAPNMAQEGYQRINKFDFIQMVKDRHSIWAAYHNYGTWMKDSDTLFTAQWLESVVAVKTNEGWKLQMMHSTRVKRDKK